ncbi:hypothetical protein QR680_005209 [Steinernema hermaphroditum]|uniref:Uncharacterized protein n=1 Tax=Steinernema hermaphroditum TaxID=289476 RepID=A0AA39LUF7_9BILA|nr:hypothetical protein QR680_005209 [Steinernema hermaphroditum]
MSDLVAISSLLRSLLVSKSARWRLPPLYGTEVAFETLEDRLATSRASKGDIDFSTALSATMNGGAGSLFSHDHFVPSPDVVTTIVLPTILFCILMVIAMLVGINKCKQWELDKVVEMRRTRRVLERITHRLRERNFRTIERARNLRKRATVGTTTSQSTRSAAPPLYAVNPPKSGTSPPPSYEDALLDQFYTECIPPSNSRSSFAEDLFF